MTKHIPHPERQASVLEGRGDSAGNLQHIEHAAAGDKFRAEALSGRESALAQDKVQPRMDARESVVQLIERGLFRPAQPADSRVSTTSDRASSDKAEERIRIKEGESRKDPVEKIKVVYSNQSNDPSQRAMQPTADFKVRKDGTIEVVKDPDKSNGKEVIIEVERDQGQVTGPTQAQQRSTEELAAYLAGRFMPQAADGTRNGTIEDQQDLISDRPRRTSRTRPAPEESLPEPTRQQVSNMQRFTGGGRGTLSPEQADSYFTPRDQVPPRKADETDEKWSLKETVAGMLTHGEARPYETTRQVGHRGWGVGRYLLTYDMLSDWLADLMGDPPDESKLDEAVKKGKISARMAQKLKSPQFKQFMEKLKSGEKPSEEAIKELLPRELQETVGGHFIDKFAEQSRNQDGKVDTGKVALAMSLGRLPTEAELARPEHQSFGQAADRLQSISDARVQNPGQPLEWQEVNQRLLLAAKQSVGRPMWSYGPWSHEKLEYGNLGCAASVSEVMKAAGVSKGMYSAGSILLEEKIIKQGGYRVSDPQPGDIVFGRRPPGGHSKGHVGIVGEDGKVYHNSSAKKKWVEADLSTVFNKKRGFIDIHYVRLPQNAQPA